MGCDWREMVPQPPPKAWQVQGRQLSPYGAEKSLCQGGNMVTRGGNMVRRKEPWPRFWGTKCLLGLLLYFELQLPQL